MDSCTQSKLTYAEEAPHNEGIDSNCKIKTLIPFSFVSS